jgi:hypothetical protein
MKHPEREDWIPFLYGEAKPSEQDRLSAHLEECEDCRCEIEGWRRSIRRLDDWKLSFPPRPIRLAPWFQWAAAAAIILAAGFGLGRLSAKPPTLEQLSAAVEPELRRQIQRDLAKTVRGEVDRTSAASLASSNQRVENLLAAFAARLDTQRSNDTRAISAALESLRSYYAANFFALKRDVDTIAVNADAGLRQTEQQLVHLAGYTEPTRP